MSADTSDLTKRLRMTRQGWFINGAMLISYDSVHDVLHEAADRIERLESDLKRQARKRRAYIRWQRLVHRKDMRALRADLAATRAERDELREALTWLCNSVEADYTPTDSRGKQTKQAIQRADAVLVGREENTERRTPMAADTPDDDLDKLRWHLTDPGTKVLDKGVALHLVDRIEWLESDLAATRAENERLREGEARSMRCHVMAIERWHQMTDAIIDAIAEGHDLAVVLGICETWLDGSDALDEEVCERIGRARAVLADGREEATDGR